MELETERRLRRKLECKCEDLIKENDKFKRENTDYKISVNHFTEENTTLNNILDSFKIKINEYVNEIKE